MGLIHNDHIIGSEQRIGLSFRQEDSVGHELDEASGREALLKANLVADKLPQRLSQLLGDPARQSHGRNASRLRNADEPSRPEARFQAHLGQLRALARSRIPRHHHHAVLAKALHNGILPRGDG